MKYRRLKRFDGGIDALVHVRGSHAARAGWCSALVEQANRDLSARRFQELGARPVDAL